MNDAAHRRWEEDVAAYALGALEEREAADVEAHLDECERCRADLRWLRPAIEVLPESVVQVSPPPNLRDELMAVVRRESRREAGRRAPGLGRRAGAGWRSWAGWRARAMRPATALAAAAIVAAAVAGYALRGGDDGEAGETVRVEARGAVAVLERTGDSGTLRVSEMPALKGEEVYQVWIRHGASVEPSSAFQPDRRGSATATIPANLEDADAVMVTREPRAGRRRPSTPPIFRAELS
jgi:anti-sigma-K factor RskA